MPKISISISQEILEFVDALGENRSKAIVEILMEYKKRKMELELAKAYEEYGEFCKEDDKDWWSDWERSSLSDINKEDLESDE